MKQVFCIVLILAVLSSAACGRQTTTEKGTPFYYCVATPAYSDSSTVIAEEYRTQLQGNTLVQMLQHYLEGPRSSELVSPFPNDLSIVSAQQEGNTVYVVVSMELTALKGLELTLACGCMTLTTLALTDAETVQISAIYGLLDGQHAITMDKNVLLLFDDSNAGE